MLKKYLVLLIAVFTFAPLYAQTEGNLMSNVNSWFRAKEDINALFEAVNSGKVKNVQEVISQHSGQALYVNSKDVKGNTPLMVAAQKGYLDILKELAGHGAKVNTTNDSNWTALCYAATNRHPKVMQYLLDLNAHADYQCGKKDLPKDTMEAIKYKYNGPVSALFLAVNSGTDAETIKHFIKKGADVNFANKDKYTVLMAEVANGKSLDSVHALVESGANVNIKTTGADLYRAAFLAVLYGKMEVLKYLLDKGAILEGATMDDGWVSLQDIAKTPEMQSFLKRKGYIK